MENFLIIKKRSYKASGLDLLSTFTFSTQEAGRMAHTFFRLLYRPSYCQKLEFRGSLERSVGNLRQETQSQWQQK